MCSTVKSDVKVGEIFDPSIAASEATFALLITPLSMVKVSPPLLTVISPLSPSLIPPPPDISATDPLSFLVKILPESVRIANSPTAKSLALGSLPLPLLSLIVLAMSFYLLALIRSTVYVEAGCTLIF